MDEEKYAERFIDGFLLAEKYQQNAWLDHAQTHLHQTYRWGRE